MGTTYHQTDSKTPKKTANTATHTHLLQRSCSDCPKKRKLLQRRAMSQSGPVAVPPIVHEVLRSPGRPLDAATRSFMESRFSHDFSRVRPHAAQQAASLTIGPADDSYEQEADRAADKVVQRLSTIGAKGSESSSSHDFSKVRVHTGSKAAESARAVGARAYTVDQSIVFAEGQYDPQTGPGQRLLAHEIVHTIQQSDGQVARLQRTIDIGHDLTSPRFAGDLKLEACYDDEARLTKGDQGDSVARVQQALIDLGYDLGPTGADGIYGDLTWNAVKQFKADQRLGWESMGDVGPGTMGRLNELYPSESPPNMTPPYTNPPTGQPGRKTFSCPDYAGDAKLEACLNDEDRLRPGETGPSVEKVQRGLINDNIFVVENADGIYGEKTSKGVMAFKKKYDLGKTQYPDVGPGTMSRLDELCGKGSPLPTCRSRAFDRSPVLDEPQKCVNPPRLINLNGRVTNDIYSYVTGYESPGVFAVAAFGSQVEIMPYNKGSIFFIQNITNTTRRVSSCNKCSEIHKGPALDTCAPYNFNPKPNVPSFCRHRTGKIDYPNGPEEKIRKIMADCDEPSQDARIGSFCDLKDPKNQYAEITIDEHFRVFVVWEPIDPCDESVALGSINWLWKGSAMWKYNKVNVAWELISKSSNNAFDSSWSSPPNVPNIVYNPTIDENNLWDGESSC